MPARTARLLLAILAAAFLSGARARVVHPGHLAPPLSGLPADAYSAARPTEVTVRHLELDLQVDFDSRVIDGTAVLHIQNIQDTRVLTLDINAMTIESITLDDGEAALWSIGDSTSFGAPLTIGIGRDTRRVTIRYRTNPHAGGLHWNTAEQTLGRVAPYLYTQNEPIDARSWIPIQDTPAVRMTYDATVRVPPGLLALMSAENPTETNDTGVYQFSMRTPIPAYLIALAVGRLEFRAIGPRSGVYAEPELIDDAAYELHYLPEMIEVAEDIAGDYPWGRYDLLMMPPTYIVGGMEHPRLNFINPAVITRNRPAQPLPSTLIAHELAHSWSGDLTTLATWADVWLNEGITSYLERRIIEEMSGTRRSEYLWFNDRRGFAELARTTAFPHTTVLHRPTGPSSHPDAFFSSAAYTKGALFLRFLEDSLGRATLDRFLRHYFATFRLRWVDDVHFLSLLQSVTGADRTALRLDEWIYAPGLPSNVSAPETSVLYDEVQALADAFRNGASPTAPAHWTSVESDLFLALIGSSAHARMVELDGVFGLSARRTPPTVWLVASIRAGYAPGLAAAERILMRGGPNNTIIQLYLVYAETSNGRAAGRAIFERAKLRYIDFVRAEAARILGVSASDLEGESIALVGQKTVGIGVLLVGLEVLGVDELPLVDVVELGEERVALEFGMDAREMHPIGAMQSLGVDFRPAADENLIISRRFRLADGLVDGTRHRDARG